MPPLLLMPTMLRASDSTEDDGAIPNEEDSASCLGSRSAPCIGRGCIMGKVFTAQYVIWLDGSISSSALVSSQGPAAAEHLLLCTVNCLF